MPGEGEAEILRRVGVGRNGPPDPSKELPLAQSRCWKMAAHCSGAPGGCPGQPSISCPQLLLEEADSFRLSSPPGGGVESSQKPPRG